MDTEPVQCRYSTVSATCNDVICSAYNVHTTPLHTHSRTCTHIHTYTMQVVEASYDCVFPAVDEGAPDVDDNCKPQSHL